MTFPTPPNGAPHDPFQSGPEDLWSQPTPDPPKRRVPEGLFLVVAAVLSAVLVLGGLLGWSRWQSNDEVAAVSTDENSGDETAVDQTTDESGGEEQTPSTTAQDEAAQDEAVEDEAADDEAAEDEPGGEDDPGGETAHVACPADVQEKICDAAAFVETFRGRPFKEFPTVELIDGDAFGDRLLRDFEDVRDQIDIQTQVWRSLGFIEPGVDLYDSYVATFEVGVVGVYFTDTKELYIQGTDLDLYAELTIVHELAHAHDDQWLDLFREEYDDADDEVGAGFSAMVEGNARRVENAWRAELSEEDEAELSVLELTVLSPSDIEILLSLPSLLLELQFFPYQDGAVLVEDIARRGGEEAVDAAIIDPPRTTEQVLHPELFEAGEAPIEVAPPPADGEIVDEGVVGELVFDLWFSDQVGDGWGGDWAVSWLTPSGGACTRIDVVGDTDTDTDEIFASAEGWSRAADGRTVERVDELVRITGCY